MTEFTATCNKPYDRDEYVITFFDGRELLFADYETLQHYWFTNTQMSKMTVSVRDRRQPTFGFA